MKDVTEIESEAPPKIGGSGMADIPACPITGMDASTGETTFTNSSWCGPGGCGPEQQSMYLEYNDVTFAGWL